jgi:PAS domain S-box-containing protein
MGETVQTEDAEKVNILLVDDQPANLLALEAILGRLGENLVKADSGMEALRKVLAHDFAVILLDVRMPDMDGFETAALIHKRPASHLTPIIFLTADQRADVEMIEGYSIGAVDFLSKPFNPDILRSKVMVFVELKKKSAVIRKQSEERKRAEEQFRGLLESAPDAMVIVSKDGRITLVNAQTETLFGYRREELLGEPIELLVPDRLRTRHPEYRARYFNSPKPRGMGTAMDLAALRKDGTEFAAEISLSPISTPDGILVTAAVRDITERKRLEEEQHRRINDANRLKSEFLANMSHELRTPLNAIIGFASLIQSTKVGPLNDHQAEYLNDILTSSRHLLQLINDVLDLAKIEAGKMDFRSEQFALPTTIGEVIDTLRGLAAEKRIRISSNIAPNLATVNIDPAKFKQVLYNYLSNAIKFTPENGTVVVGARPEGDDWFRLEVEDSGIGIAPQDMPRLFVEFQQLDAPPTKRFGGTGLGLSLTKRIVEAQGGSVSVHSELGKGSIFVAVLPRTMPDPEQRPAASPPPPSTGADRYW